MALISIHIFFSYEVESNWDERVESFDNMGLREELLRGIYGYGFERPSVIQQKAIVPLLRYISFLIVRVQTLGWVKLGTINEYIRARRMSEWINEWTSEWD